MKTVGTRAQIVLSLMVLGLFGVLAGVSAQEKPSAPKKGAAASEKKMSLPPLSEHDRHAIAHFSQKAGVLWVVKARRAEVARLYKVENAASNEWNIQIPGREATKVHVLEVEREIPRYAMGHDAMDVSSFENMKCSGHSAASTNVCTNNPDGSSTLFNSSAFDYCVVADKSTCTSQRKKVGTWKYFTGKGCTGNSSGETDYNEDVC